MVDAVGVGGKVWVMSKKCDDLTKIRLDSSVYDLLCEIKTKCDWPVTLGVLANYAIVRGIGMTRKAFNPKSKCK